MAAQHLICGTNATSDKNSARVTLTAKPAGFQTHLNITRLFLAYHRREWSEKIEYCHPMVNVTPDFSGCN